MPGTGPGMDKRRSGLKSGSRMMVTSGTDLMDERVLP
jgi:hypothetical protein